MLPRRTFGKRWCGRNNNYIFLFLSAAFVGGIESLANNQSSRHQPKTTSFGMAAAGRTAGRSCVNGDSEALDMQSNGSKGDTDGYLYAYVHPSIHEILVMEPPRISVDFLESAGLKDDTNNPILVDNESHTIGWNLLDAFIEHENSEPQKSGLQQTLSMEQLVSLASQSELALLKGGGMRDDSLLPSSIRGLLQIIPEKHYFDEKNCSNRESGEYFLIATLLALNMVENSIRHLLGKENGKAPLLKDMIDIISTRQGDNALPKSLLAVLRTLLLPKNGLNLRNLLWHGFLPTIHPRWFALSVVLVLSLDELTGSSSFQDHCLGANLQNLSAMRQHHELVAILDHGRALLSSREMMTTFERRVIRSKIIPRSHVELFRVSLKFVNFPIVFASVAGPLIEHLLRLMWCDENKQNKYIAEPGSYYVTLDGHGQRGKHEVVIMPFFSQPQQVNATETNKNQLVYRLGGSRMAFLMDMFTAPSGAPNIRASVAHGAFNKHLFEELVAIEGEKDGTGKNVDELKDMTSAFISVLNTLCDDVQCCPRISDGTNNLEANVPISLYRPCFSYSAILLAELDSMVNKMKPFYKFIHDGHYLKYARNASQSQMQEDVAYKVADMSQSIETIVGMQESIYRSFKRKKSKFTDDDFFRENTNNLRASECGAAQLLLSEISQAASSSLQDLNDGIAMLQEDKIQLSSRRRKQIYRICSSAKLTLDFYSFAAYCALLYIDSRQDDINASRYIDLHTKISGKLTDDDFFVAVKRSRMAVSTFSTTNTFNRALSALTQYAAGKAVKAISKNSIRESSI